jgi:hypothetical protein
MSLEKLPTKIQYLVIDSNYINQGTKNNFSINFGYDSNTFVQEMKDVIGVQLVDFYVTQVGTNDNGSTNAAKYFDIYCPELPIPAQLLSERSGNIFARVPLERNFGGSNSIVVYDKQAKLYNRKKNLFNPISIKNLTFQLYEYQGDGDYNLIKDSTDFYMILEITTIDHQEKVVNTKLEDSLDRLNNILEKLIPEANPEANPVEVAEREGSIPKYYIWSIIAVMFLCLVYLIFTSR